MKCNTVSECKVTLWSVASLFHTLERTHSILLARQSVLKSMRYRFIVSGVKTTPIGPVTCEKSTLTWVVP
jgi:hypothetical protein